MSDRKLRLPAKLVVAVVGTMGMTACPTPEPNCGQTTCTTDAALAISQSDASPEPGYCQNWQTDAGECHCFYC